MLIMGILNITPDSFSDGNLYFDCSNALKQLYKLIEEGADIIDIGAESTRPNAVLIDEYEEWKRLEPILQEIKKNKINIPFSIDTRKATIAQKCLEMGIKFVNDVSSLEDEKMLDVLNKFPKSSIILTHHRGLPATAQNFKPNLKITREIIVFFEERIKKLKNHKNQIILDLGFGFGKGLEENLLILHKIDIIKKHFDFPLLVGLSRKRFVKQLWSEENADWASVVLSSLAVHNGADIIRCHKPILFYPLKKVFNNC